MKIILSKGDRKSLTALREIACNLTAWGAIITGIIIAFSERQDRPSYSIPAMLVQFLCGGLVVVFGAWLLHYFAAKGWRKNA